MISKIIFAFIICILPISSAFGKTPSSSEKQFQQGMNAGMMDKFQYLATEDFLDLQFLPSIKDKGADHYKQKLIKRLNMSLYSLSYVDKMVSVRPESLKQIELSNLADRQRFFETVRSEREKNKWIDPDPERESRIQWTLKRYIEMGNIYGFK